MLWLFKQKDVVVHQPIYAMFSINTTAEMRPDCTRGCSSTRQHNGVTFLCLNLLKLFCQSANEMLFAFWRTKLTSLQLQHPVFKMCHFNFSFNSNRYLQNNFFHEPQVAIVLLFSSLTLGI